MILFYYALHITCAFTANEFQFHYDLILLSLISIEPFSFVKFQFHYDLILLKQIGKTPFAYAKFQFHYDLILLTYFQYLLIHLL